MSALLRCSLCCAFFLFSLSANAQSGEARKLLPRSELFATPPYRDVQLGSEGKRIWYRRAGVPDTLYYTSARNSRYAHAVALPGHLVHYRTVLAGGLVVVTAADAEVRLHYWRRGRLKEITPFALSDARVLATSQRFPNKVVMRLSAKDETRSGVWLVDLWGSTPRRIGRYDTYEALWFDQMFNPVAAEASADGGRLLLALSPGRPDTLGYYPDAPSGQGSSLQHIVSVSADGKSIFFTDDEGRDKTVLMHYTCPTKRFDKLAEDARADILPWGAAIGGDGRVQAVAARWADMRYHHLIEEAVRADLDRLDSLLEGQVYWAGASADDSLWLVHTLDGTPARYYTYDRRHRRLYHLFSTMPALSQTSRFGKRRAWTVYTPDSLALPVHVYLPPQSDRNDDGLPREPLPTLFITLGPPRTALVPWDDWLHVRHFQLLANRGYAVVVCAPADIAIPTRFLAPKDAQSRRDETHRRLMDVVDWAVQQRIAHPDRLALWNWADGIDGIARTLAREPARFRCGIATHGLTVTEVLRREAEAGTPQTDTLAHWAEQIQTPLFLAAAGMDTHAARRQMDAFAKMLAEAERELVYVVYPDASSEARAATWISFWALAEQFLAHHLGGRYQPAGDDPEKSKCEFVYGQDFINRIDW